MNNDMTEQQIERRRLLAEIADSLAEQLGDKAGEFRAACDQIVAEHSPAPTRAQMRSLLKIVA